MPPFAVRRIQFYHPTLGEEVGSVSELKKGSIGFDVPRKIRDVARLRDVPVEFITV